MTAAVVVDKLSFGYQAQSPVIAIPHMSIDVGRRVFIHGPSGSGKTTLLGLLAGILSPQSGAIRVLNQDLGELSASARDTFRGAHIGFIFQMFNLLPYLNVRDNMQLACRLSPARRQRLAGLAIDAATRELAGHLAIEDFLDKAVTDLSVGQQQRVAVGRALLGAPEIIIADEPTSALDADRKDKFIELLFAEAKRISATVIFVSHDLGLKGSFDEVISLAAVNEAVQR